MNTHTHSNAPGGEFTLPGTSVALKRVGYGAMQLAGRLRPAPYRNRVRRFRPARNSARRLCWRSARQTRPVWLED